MKINKTEQKRSSKLFLSLLLVAILLAGWLVFAYVKGNWPFEADDTDTTSTEQTIKPEEQEAIDDENAQQKQDFLDKQEDTDVTDKPDADKPDSQTPDKNKDDTVINLSARTQDNLLVVTTDLSTVSSGTCTLKLQKGQKTVTKSANVIFAPRSSTCEGFSIPKSELGSGNWRITLSVSTDGKNRSKSINYNL